MKELSFLFACVLGFSSLLPLRGYAAGWTEFALQPGARVIHVANDGDDSNPGTLSRPKASFAGGYEELRDGKADWLLLRRGDTWELPPAIRWSKSGPEAAEAGWMRLGAYGDEKLPRPILDSKSADAIHITPGYRSDRVLSHIAITDIYFLASERLANTAEASSAAAAISYIAAEWRGTGRAFRHMHCENVKIRGFNLGVNIGHNLEDFRLRRSILADIFSPGAGAHAQGVLTSAEGCLLEENVFFRIQHPDTPGVPAISFYSHPAYITAEATGVVCRGNFIFRTTEGFMVRAGGIYERNVSAENAIAGMYGQAYGVNPTPGGVEATINQNLFLNNGGAFHIGNTRKGTMTDNLLLRNRESTAEQNLTLIGSNPQGKGTNIGVRNMTFSGNVITGTVLYSNDEKDTAHYESLTFTGNRLGLEPIRPSMGDFLKSIGLPGATIPDYANVLVERDRTTFGPATTTDALINFHRNAVGMTPLP